MNRLLNYTPQRDVKAAHAASFLNAQQAPPFFFSGVRQTIHATSPTGVITEAANNPQALLEAVASERQKISGCGWIVGALPFERSAASHLLHPEQVVWSEAWQPSQSIPAASALARRHNQKHSEARFQKAVQTALQEMSRGELSKVVLAQANHISLSEEVCIPELLARLRGANPAATTYAMRLPHEGHKACLVGSSPELLVSRRGRRVRCLPLAGSRKRSADPALDQKLEKELFSSRKDHLEHKYLVEELVANLSPLVEDLSWPSEPGLIQTSTMWHLATQVEGTLRDPKTTSLELALALHPTAAVCGVPQQKANEFIRQHEGFDRSFFGGTLGYMDQNGDGEWIVTIRCAEVKETQARIFAGAGIISASDPQLECQETNDKMQTILRALASNA